MSNLRRRLVALSAASAALALSGQAYAWEVVGGGGLPVFAAGVGAPSALAPLGMAATAPSGFNPGYDFLIGQKLLVGVDTKTGFAATEGLLGFSSGLDASRTGMKFGYDMGRFKPFVMSSFTDLRPAFGAGFAGPVGGLAGAGSPFAPSTKISTVGAGFDFAITDQLSLGMSVSASQVNSGWPR